MMVRVATSSHLLHMLWGNYICQTKPNQTMESFILFDLKHREAGLEETVKG
jgi:hypothetical protein